MELSDKINKSNSKHIDGDLEERINKMSSKKIMVTGDYHIPYIDNDAYGCMKDYIKSYKPDVFVINGDFIDCYSISFFDKNPNRKFGIKDETDLAKEYIKDLRKTLPKKTKMYFLDGNHPLVKDTEVLTQNGFKNIVDIRYSDKVANFNINTNEVEFNNPLGKQKYFADNVYEIENTFHKQVVSRKHRVILDGKVFQAGYLYENQNLLKHFKLPMTANRNINKVDILDEDLKLLVWTVMDGTVVDYAKYNSESKKVRLQFKLSKKRKINELRSLLDESDIPYTFKECKKTGYNKLQPYYIRIYGDYARKIWYLLDKKKEFPTWFRNLNRYQTKIVLEVISKTDGYLREDTRFVSWTSTNKNNIDIMQELSVLNGFYFKYVIRDPSSSGFESNKFQYHASFYMDKPLYYTTPKINKLKYNDFVYCLTMPLGTLITRIDGKVGMTGNCNRVERRLWKDPDMYDLLSGYINIKNLLDLDKYKIEHIGVEGDYWKKDNGHILLGDMLITHGDNRLNGTSTSKWAGYSVKNSMLTLQHSIIQNHVHRMAQIYHTTPYGKLIGLEAGCVCQLTGTANWQQGFVTFETIGDKSVNHRLHYIDNGMLYEDGKIYRNRGKNPKNINIT